MSGTTHGLPSGGHGRHRRDSGAAAWTPVTPRASERAGRHARPDPWPTAGHSAAPTVPILPSPRLPARWPADDEDVGKAATPDEAPTEPQALRPLPAEPLCPESGTGLSKFNLGGVPASVTPPKSWRGAALFTVFASAGVLVTLVFVSTSIVEPSTGPGHIGALPGMGTHLPYEHTREAASGSGTTGTTTSAAATSSRERSTGAMPSSLGIVRDGTTVVIAGDAPGSHTAPGDPGGPSSAPRHDPGPPTVVTAPQPSRLVKTKPHTEAPPMVDDTKAYFAKVANQPRQASQLTGGSLHSEGADGISRRYPDARSVEVRRIEVDPSQGTTTNSITVHKDDGSTTTKTRTLEFTPGDDPEIVADHA